MRVEIGRYSFIFSIRSSGDFLELQFFPQCQAILVPYKKLTNAVTNRIKSVSAITMSASLEKSYSPLCLLSCCINAIVWYQIPQF